MPYRSVDPATGEVLKTFIEHTDQEMMNASAKAHSAFISWAGRSIEESAKIISRATQLLLEEMELGGSDAFIVLDDADLDHTITMAILGRFGNNVQTCVGTKRFIVVESILDKFIPRFIAVARELKRGTPLDGSVTLGPLSSDAALQLILGQLRDALHRADVLLVEQSATY